MPSFARATVRDWVVPFMSQYAGVTIAPDAVLPEDEFSADERTILARGTTRLLRDAAASARNFRITGDASPVSVTPTTDTAEPPLRPHEVVDGVLGLQMLLRGGASETSDPTFRLAQMHYELEKERLVREQERFQTITAAITAGATTIPNPPPTPSVSFNPSAYLQTPLQRSRQLRLAGSTPYSSQPVSSMMPQSSLSAYTGTLPLSATGFGGGLLQTFLDIFRQIANAVAEALQAFLCAFLEEWRRVIDCTTVLAPGGTGLASWNAFFDTFGDIKWEDVLTKTLCRTIDSLQGSLCAPSETACTPCATATVAVSTAAPDCNLAVEI